MKLLTVEQLNKLSDERLFIHMKMVTATISMIYHHFGRRCCEICCEYIGADWYNDVVKHAEPYEAYKLVVKPIMDARHYDRSQRRRKGRK